MKTTSQLFICLFLCFNLSAQDKITTFKKAQRVLQLLQTDHLMPAKTGDELSLRIHASFIDLLDDDKSIFTAENILILEPLAKNLAQNILDQDSTYLNKVKEIYINQLKEAQAICTKSFAQKEIFNPQKKILQYGDSVFVSQKQFAEMWESTIQNANLRPLIESLKEVKFVYSKDSLISYYNAGRKNTEQQFTDYFKNVLNDQSYIADLYLNAIAQAFDPHSDFFNREMNQQFSQELTSEREFFGISYTKNLKQEIEITLLTPGSSAWMSGNIHPGDIVLSFTFGNGPEVSTSGMTHYQVSQLFDNNLSKSVLITLRNEKGETKKVALEKGKVYSDEDIIKSALLEGNKKIGYISLPDFYMNWTDTTSLGCANDVAKALVKLKKETFDGLILDLRDNGGGSLQEAIDLVGIFIDYGPVLVQKDYLGHITTLKDFNRGSVYSGPLMILINENSASASEVVAGAIQDYNRGIIVGQKSFGKATGQIIMPVDPLSKTIVGSMKGPNEDWGYLKITDIGLYRIDLTTNQMKGVVPDVELMNPYTSDEFREKDYPYPLEIPAIEKKMYYTPLAEINTSSLKILSEKRQMLDEEFIKTKELLSNAQVASAKLNNENRTIALILENEKNKFSEVEKFKSGREKTTVFQPKAVNYDQGMYSMNSYLKTYQDDFFESILLDRELKEAYLLMIDFINQ